MLTLIENGFVYSPEPRGVQSVLLAGDRIEKIGEVDRRAIEASGLDLDVVDASDCLVTPGLIDSHEHLLGGSGEDGFSSQTPEIFLRELAVAGVTTVVGCLGVDTTTKTMPGLLARAKALDEEGLTAFIWSGGYNVPPTTITGSIRDDLIFIDEVIGAGEVAISDNRATEPAIEELARLVSDVYVGGMLSGKSGVTHFHVGDHPKGLSPLRALIENHAVKPQWLYPTHIDRTRELTREAAAFTRLGAFVDIDMTEENLQEHLRRFIEDGGDLNRLTVSSDAAIASPRTLYDQMRACVAEHGFALERVLSLATANTARVLKLARKGRLEQGRDADALVLRRNTLEITHVFALGKPLVRDGEIVVTEKFLARSNRRISLYGGKS
ncbi:MAG TPA: amidohydrolase family protein [Blastocatellia bacterium]|nr:amidohydrolase family protein [Blastocatellia bacterium]